MQVKNRWKKITILLGIVGLALLICFMVLENKRITTTKSNFSSNNTMMSSRFNDELIKQNNLRINTLSPEKDKILSAFNKKLVKKNFFGMYVLLDKGKVTYSAQRGSANAESNNAFRLNSVFLIGRLQYLMNNIMILKLADQGKIDLSDNLSKYVANGYLKKLTIRQLLTENTHLYINKKALLPREPLSNLQLDSVIRKSLSEDDSFMDATEIIKADIISKVGKKKYSTMVNDLLVNPLTLENTRVSEVNDKQANDVISYGYYRQGKTPVQKKVVDYSNSIFQGYTMRMSVSDLMIVIDGALKGKIFTPKLLPIFAASLVKDKVEKNGYLFHSEAYGQNIYIRLNKAKKSIMFVGTNFPSKKVQAKQVISELESVFKD